MATRETKTGIPAPWKGKAFLLVDLDAFFASVEQLDHPEWRGKPVIVGGDAEKRGVVSTASYEARVYGVHSAMPSAQARRLCPDAIWAHARFDRYRELSGKVMDILRNESPLLQQVSIDEAYLDVTPGRYLAEDPVEIALRIQERVSKLGITCSIGVANGKVTAKIASERDKPRGLTVVYPGSEADFLAPLPIRALPGIGKRSAERLNARGIKTLGQLAACDPGELEPIFGVNAAVMCGRAAGIDGREIEVSSPVKSVGNERTFERDLRDRGEIEDAIDLIAPMVGRRLRKKGLAGHTVTLKLRFSDLSRRTAQRTLSRQVDDENVFIPIAKELVDEIWRPGDAVRLVGVTISGFNSRGAQLDLFEKDELPQGKPEVMSAADKIRDRFGDDMLKFGRQLKMKTDTTGTTSQSGGKD